jgi:hypothetical protein
MHSIETKQHFFEKQYGNGTVIPALQNKIRDTGYKTVTFLVCGLMLLSVGLYYYSIPASYYRSPLDLSTEVAGTFGEVRKNHFHLGLDIRTGGMENLPVRAMADGYIYRVSIQPDGYGKALYIAYTNGMMSVYGHLNSFSEEVESAILEQQQLSERWNQEMFFESGRFPVKKGMIVAYSGNTGSSEGPHLHVELRNAKTKTIINPVTAGLWIPDHHSPFINSIFVYNGSGTLYKSKGREIRIKNDKSRKETATKIIEIGDPLIRIGVEAGDRNDQAKFRLGIHQAELFLDGRLQFKFKMDSIPILKERYVNATIDYAQWIQNNRCIQLLSVLPGNHLPAYQQKSGNGILDISDGLVHLVEIIVKDDSGNSKSVILKMQYKRELTRRNSTFSKMLRPGVAHKVSSRSAVVYFSPLAFYDAIPFRMDEFQSNAAGQVSAKINVHNHTVPVHTRYRMQLKCNLPRNDPSRKYVLMELSSGNDKQFLKGEWRGDYMDGTFDRFGTVRLIIDSVSPVLSILGRKSDKITNGDYLRVQTNDKGSCIETFTAKIDGLWVPFEQKKNVFQYRLEKLLKGKHNLEVEVTDKAGNRKREITYFVIK